MAEGEIYEVVLAAHNEAGQAARLTVAELGVLLTGLNRSLNSVTRKLLDLPLDYAPLAQEPSLLQLEVTEVRNGSIVLLLQEMNTYATQNPVQAGLLINAASAALGVALKAALRRVKKPGPEKTFTITLTHRQARAVAQARLRNGKVDLIGQLPEVSKRKSKKR